MSGKKFSNKDSLEYLKQFDISSVLSMALGELYISNPKNQLYFLGNWLVNFSKSQQNLNVEVEKTQTREDLQDQYQKSLLIQQQTEENLRTEAQKLKQIELDLQSELSSSLDIYDLLPKIIEHIKVSTFSAAGYIGLLEKIKRPVTDLDDDKAHIEDDAPLVLRYITASKNSHWMIGQVLKEEEGQATWTIWKEDEEEAQLDEENPEPVQKPRLKLLSIDDVVNDPRIKFFDVPKLGAYLAAPVTYMSCLSESSFDLGVEDAIECRKKRILQLEEKQKYELENKEDEEPKVFEEIKEEKFKANEVRIVVALDTLGLDKVFSDGQKDYLTDWALLIKDQMERAEDDCLRRDIQEYLSIKDFDSQRIEKLNEWAEEEKNLAEDALKVAGATIPEELKQYIAQDAVFELHRNRVLAEFQTIFKFQSFKVVKFARLFQLAFYLSGIEKERLVEPGTNMIQWKKGREFLNKDFEEFIKTAQPKGPKDHKPFAYAKTLRLEKDLKRLPLEEVNNFSLSLGLLYKFIESYLRVRILDVTKRRKEYLSKVDVREAAENAARELNERKRKYVEDAKEAFDKEFDAALDDSRAFFDATKVMEEFDGLEGNLPVVIPEVPVSDVDEDIDWEDSNPTA